jgi:hypothetical protein
VRLQDLPRVQGWAFINSLRGWLQANLADSHRLQPPAPAVLVQWFAIGMDRCEPTEDGGMALFQGIFF